MFLFLTLFCILSHDRNNSTGKDAPENCLTGKTAIFLGDSICAGKTVDKHTGVYGYGWAGLIGERNGMVWKNYGRNGAVIAQIEGQERIVAMQLEQAEQDFERIDYILFEGGWNDADQLGNVAEKLGELSPGFDDFDCSTFTGAFETLILQMVTTYPDAKIGYIIPPKMGEAPYGADGNVYRQFYDRAIEVCEKWGIPYLDLWNENPMNPELAVYYDSGIQKEAASGEGLFYTDGKHLTLRGYQRILSQIEAFLRSL